MTRIAIVGIGPHGKRLVESALHFVSDKELAVVDIKSEAIEQIECSNKFMDFELMLEAFKPNVCVISSNGPSHYNLAKKAILRGVKKILITKPLTCKLDESHELVNLARKYHVKIAVDHGLRYDKTYEWVCKKIKEEIWGDLLLVNIMRNGIGLGCLGTHSFDLANLLFNANPISVTAWIDNSYKVNPRGEYFIDPGGLVVLDYGNDRKAIINQIEKAYGPMIVQLHFEYARLVIDVKFGTLELVSKSFHSLSIQRQVNPQDFQVSHETVPLMSRILENLLSDEPMKADALNGMNAVEILVASYQSSEQGHVPITLPVTDINYLNKFLPVT